MSDGQQSENANKPAQPDKPKTALKELGEMREEVPRLGFLTAS